MAEHRRVEARTTIAGSGMATDAERIESVADEQARRERTWRAPPELGFADVLSTTPAQAELALDTPQKSAAPKPTDATLPKVPLDPRAAQLHRMLKRPRSKT